MATKAARILAMGLLRLIHRFQLAPILMFTGIVQNLGEVLQMNREGGGASLVISARICGRGCGSWAKGIASTGHA